jgi:hypothetical protein
METTIVKISQIVPNEGQVEGLPNNPRQIKNREFELLKKSMEESPEMLHLREIIVYPHGKKYVVIGGNMRLRAAKALGFKELPCKILPEDTPIEKLREYCIKDNNGFGEDDWDILANEWDAEELQDWGMELPMDWGQEDEPPTDLDADRQAKDFVCKITFDTKDKIDEFMQKYESLISDEFSCTISVSCGML